MKKIIAIILITFIPLSAQQKTDLTNSGKSVSDYEQKLDTALIAYKHLQQELDYSKRLIETIEKTNQQLSLWSNPYGVFIASLGVLFTVMTIFFAGFLFMQSREYKERFNKLLKSYEIALEKLISDWNERKVEIDKQIADNKSKLSSTTDKQKIKEIEKQLEKLKQERESMDFPLSAMQLTGNYLSGSGYSGYSGYSGSIPLTQTCEKCKNIYSLPVTPTIISGTGKSYTECPSCGHHNEYKRW